MSRAREGVLLIAGLIANIAGLICKSTVNHPLAKAGISDCVIWLTSDHKDQSRIIAQQNDGEYGVC